MNIYKKPFSALPQLSGFDKAYVNAAPALRPFYKYEVRLDAFEQIIADKKKEKIDRALLVEVLQSQYADVPTTEKVLQNIEALRSENTFTVLTAHQPSLFTGPLYFIYKTLSTINLAEQLAARYPDYRFVPLFWIGGEDHDFEEINHVHLFGKTFFWENDEHGATGTMHTETLLPTLKAVQEVLGNSENAVYLSEVLERCFTQYTTYGKAMMAFTNVLFEQYGLVLMSGNDARLKRIFAPVVRAELETQVSERLVNATIERKEAAGFRGQAFVRPINFFYLAPNIRERIVFENGNYHILNTDLTFSPSEMWQEVEQFPERFSPNVIMRPLYQEMILPNLAYIGGGGELSYWTERLPQFEHYGVNFPMLIRRNSALWVEENSVQKLAKLGLSIDDLFGETEALIKAYITKNTDENLSLTTEKATLERLFKEILAKAKAIDPTLEKAVLGEATKQLNGIAALESRLFKAEKRHHDTTVQQIRNLKDKLFPENGLQERYDNFIPLYLKHGNHFIETLKVHLDPLCFDFLIFCE